MNSIDSAMEEYAGQVYTDRFLVSGHSQGGGAGHTCQYLLEARFPDANVVSATIQPAHGMNRPTYMVEYPQIRGPVFMMSGSRDAVVSDLWINLGFQRIQSEKYWYVAVGATHWNPHDWAKTSILSFGQWKLFSDELAGNYFSGLLDFPEFWRTR